MVDWLSGLPHPLIVFVMAMLPVLERLAVIAGFGFHVKFHDMPWTATFTIGVVGNVLGASIFYALLGPISAGLMRFRAGQWLLGRFYHKVRRRQDVIERHGVWGLTILVAIPSPITGPWAGALIAHVLGLNWFRSLLALTIGVVIATSLLVLATYGGVEALGFLLK